MKEMEVFYGGSKMGDGRFYTGSQFFNIIFLTMLIIFVVISIMLCLYKGAGNKSSKRLLYIYICLGAMIVLRFMEGIVVSEGFAYFLRCVMSIAFIACNFSFLNFLFRYIIDDFYSSKKQLVKGLSNMTYMLLGIFLIISLADTSLIITSYSFDLVEFGTGYIVVVGVSFILLFFINAFLFKYRHKTNTLKININSITLTTFLFWIIPLGFYFLCAGLYEVNTRAVELIIFMLFSVGLCILSSYFMPYRVVSSSIFNNVKDLILDYVFIIDSDGHIIYKNKSVEESEFFNKIDTIDINNIQHVFTKEVIKRNAYGKLFIKYVGDKNIYFSYSEKHIKKDNKVAGSIITFIDITSLIKMLDELENKNQETKKLNSELSHYSKIVYDLEKEKEINNLLGEIANNQEQSMIKLKKDIVTLIDNNDNFMLEIDKISAEAKEDLFDVRQAVSAYMNYYGGEND